MGEARKSWVENIYWSHFQVVQFFQVLSGDFDQQLAIPQKFANNLREKLAGSVSLKGPGGAMWNVGLTANGNALFLKNGWKEFVDAHILEENDLLIFKYIGDSRFDVLMFDRQSFCEKEASYFVKKCAHTDVAGVRTNMSVTESADGDSQFDGFMLDGQSFCEKESSYYVQERPHTDVVSGDRTKRSGTESADGDAQYDVLMLDGQSSEKEASYFVEECGAHTDVISANTSSHEVADELTGTKQHENDGACTPTSGAQANSKLQTKESKSTKIRSPGGQWKSNRRPVTEEEKRKAFGMATAALAENSVLVVMRPSHVYKVFYMPVPTQWARVHLPRRSVDVTLRLEEKTWPARFHHRGFNGRFKDGFSGGLTGGWKNFVVENFLEEFDVCVFNITHGEDAIPILDVSIFRVVEDVIPPSLITPPSSSKKGRKPRKATTKKTKKKSIVDEDGSFQAPLFQVEDVAPLFELAPET